MSIYASFLKQLGLAKESVRGAVEVLPTKWVAVTPDSELNYSVALLDDPSVRGIMSKYPSIAGMYSGTGSIKFPLRASDIGEFIQMLIGNPTTTENTAFVVQAGVNDKINFTEDGGAEVTATLTAGSYAMGTSSAQAGTLCALIKAQMEVVNGADTYTVTYSRTTRKLTITKSAGVFVAKWSTGTNTLISAKTLLGFTVDTASAISCVSDSTTSYPAFSHAFKPTNILEPQSFSMFMDRGIGVKAYNLCNASVIKITRVPDTFINFDATIMFKGEDAGAIGSPVFTESEELTFQHDSIKIANSTNTQVKSWEVNLTNGLFAQKTVSGSRNITNLLATEYDANGTMTVYFETTAERDKFVAGTETSLEITISGDTITGASKYKIVLLLESVQYSAYPYGIEDGLLTAKTTWKANYYSANSRIYLLTLTNIKESY